jgi:hypothetical protein
VRKFDWWRAQDAPVCRPERALVVGEPGAVGRARPRRAARPTAPPRRHPERAADLHELAARDDQLAPPASAAAAAAPPRRSC